MDINALFSDSDEDEGPNKAGTKPAANRCEEIRLDPRGDSFIETVSLTID
jgi:hypothetical protein